MSENIIEKESDNDENQLGNAPAPQNPVVVVRKPKKKKKNITARKEFEVQVIPATKGVTPPGEEAPIKRVAAYCRVSTDEEAQSTSFDLQVKHYTEYIGAQENWVLAGIYADEGISGTQVKHREQFQKMIEDCEAGQIDMIITKSISRFARNTVDCLTTIYAYISMCGLLWSNWCEFKRNLGVEFGEYSLRQYRFAKDYYRYAIKEQGSGQEE